MGRPRKKVETPATAAPDLLTSKESKWPDGAPVSPEILEYQPKTETQRWRVERFEDFVIEFEVAAPWEAAMVRFHEAAAAYPRAWQLVRRLFGLGPVMPPDNASPEDLRVWTRAELLGHHGLEPAQLAAEFETLRVLYKKQPVASATPPPIVQEELDVVADMAAAEALLKNLGFSEDMFRINVMDEQGKEMIRPTAENETEREWFVKRINEGQWKLMLTESMSAVQAREAVLNELTLRRLDREMNRVSPISEKYQRLRSTKRDIYEQYKQQMAELREMFPENDMAGKVQARATLAGFLRAVVEYKANQDNTLVDGIRTQFEVDIELTPSLQAPAPSYRMGQNTYLLEAMHHLFDPDFRSQLRFSTLRVLDQALPKAMVEIREALSMPLPDLEKGVLPGEGEGFEDFSTGAGKESNLSEEERTANS